MIKENFMKTTHKVNNMYSRRETYIEFEQETICPICKHAISPDYVASTLNTEKTASILNYCRACQSTFVTNYKIRKSGKSTQIAEYYDSEKIESLPNRFQQEKFDEKVASLSPSFVKIYNQALAAETQGLDEIAGIGYRKSLEFLVKDFAIHEHPDNIDDIKVIRLAKCIEKYIDDTRIATLAEKSAWIGNDETHYVRKQEDRDVSDMKKFIKAMLYFIGMVLTTEDAYSMEAM